MSVENQLVVQLAMQTIEHMKLTTSYVKIQQNKTKAT